MKDERLKLIFKLVQDGAITPEEGLLLMETEKEYVYVPQYPVYPHYTWWNYNPLYVDYNLRSVSSDGTEYYPINEFITQ